MGKPGLVGLYFNRYVCSTIYQCFWHINTAVSSVDNISLFLNVSNFKPFKTLPIKSFANQILDQKTFLICSEFLLFQVCDPVVPRGMAMLSITLATLRRVYELGWNEPCVKVGVKLLHSCYAQAWTRLVALSDTRGFRGDGQAFRKVSLSFEGSFESSLRQSSFQQMSTIKDQGPDAFS